jgi:hypothetical protein
MSSGAAVPRRYSNFGSDEVLYVSKPNGQLGARVKQLSAEPDHGDFGITWRSSLLAIWHTLAKSLSVGAILSIGVEVDIARSDY